MSAMCYSAQIEAAYQKLVRMTGATLSLQEFSAQYAYDPGNMKSCIECFQHDGSHMDPYKCQSILAPISLVVLRPLHCRSSVALA